MPDIRALVITPDDATEPAPVSVAADYLAYQHILGAAR